MEKLYYEITITKLKCYKPFVTDISDGAWRDGAFADFFDASAATTDCLQNKEYITFHSIYTTHAKTKHANKYLKTYASTQNCIRFQEPDDC